MPFFRRHKEVGSSCNYPVTHYLRIKIGASGAVSSFFTGGSGWVTSVALGTTGRYTVTVADTAPFYVAAIHPSYHKASATAGVVNVSYEPGTYTKNGSTFVTTFVIQCSADTAANNTTQVATNPGNGSEIHLTLVEAYNTALRPVPQRLTMPTTPVNDQVNETGLIQRAQAYADMEGDFVKPRQWLQSVNYWHKRLSMKIARLGYPLNQVDVSIPLNGSIDYLVPEPLAFVGLFFVRTDGTFKKLERLNPVQYRTNNPSTNGDPSYYHIRRAGNNCIFNFYPNPPSGTVVAMTIPHPEQLTLNDSVTYPLGFEEYIVVNMAMFALGKEESSIPSSLVNTLQEVTAHIEDSVTSYLMTDGARIRNIHEDNYPSWCDPTTWVFM